MSVVKGSTKSVVTVPQFKTVTCCRLWKRYLAASENFTNNKSVLKGLKFPLLPTTDPDISFYPDCIVQNNLSSNQLQTWSLYTRLKELFCIPIVYCEGVQLTEQGSVGELGTASGADVLERNFEARKRHAVSSPGKGFVSKIEIMDFIDGQTGMDRLKGIFDKDVHAESSPELKRIQAQLAVMLFPICIGSMVFSGLRAREEFIHKNKPTVFVTKGMAMRRLTDQVFLGSIKGGLPIVLKLGFFATSLLCLSEGIAIYRNKTSPLEYVAAAGVTGAMVRWFLGPKGMISGGLIGSTLGLGIGVIMWALMKATNETQEARHYKKIEALLTAEATMVKMLQAIPKPKDDEKDYDEAD